eukprot:154078-Alexandrium_andersonii.AAC.1
MSPTQPKSTRPRLAPEFSFHAAQHERVHQHTVTMTGWGMSRRRPKFSAYQKRALVLSRAWLRRRNQLSW